MDDRKKRKRFYRNLVQQNSSCNDILIDKILELEDSVQALQTAYNELLVFTRNFSPVCVHSPLEY